MRASLFQIWAFILLGLCITPQWMSAQTVRPNCVDGQIYVRLSHDSDLILSSLEAVYRDPAFAALHPLIDTYQITTFRRPFLALHEPRFDRTYRWQFEAQTAVQQLIQDLEAIPWIEYAEPVPLYRADVIPNDALWAQVGNHLQLIEADLAWDLHTGGGATVAIIDNAVQADHPDLAANMWVNPGEIPGNGIDDDSNGYIDDVHGFDVSDDDGDINPPVNANASFFAHGSHCAGIASASTDNGVGIAAVGHSCRIIGVKATPNTVNPVLIPNAAEGFAYAIAVGADVISASFGGGPPSQTAEDAIREAYDRGIMIVASAGNNANNVIQYPAGYDRVISVASTTVQDVKSGFSTFGTWVDISAPGSNIFSTVPFDGYSFQSGTSMAAPMVAGLLALMKSYRPGLPPSVYEYVMFQTAENIDIQNPDYLGQLGAGRINAFRALREITNCYPLAANTEGPRIDSVELAGQLQPAPDSCANYTFDWDAVTYHDPSQPLSLRFQVNTCGAVAPRQLAAWVDWNADGDFADSLEQVWETGFFAGDTLLEEMLSIPGSVAVEKNIRLRLIVREDTGVIDPCQDYLAGETEDHLLYFIPQACPPGNLVVSEFPYIQDFEAFTACDTTAGVPCGLAEGWENGTGDQLDWLVWSGPSPTPSTGPSQDIVPEDVSGTYLYLEASQGQFGDQAQLLSPCIDLTGLIEPEVAFAYHMSGSDMGRMILEVRGEGIWETLWTDQGNRQDLWRIETISLGAYGGQTIRLRWVAERGDGPLGDMAIGLVNLGNRRGCEGEAILRETAGDIEDGSGIWRNYGPQADCRWLIQPYNTSQIRVGFERFRTIPGQDFLRAYDGEDMLAPELVAYSGFSADSLTVDGGSLYLQFSSDPAFEQDGWLLNYSTDPLLDVLDYPLTPQVAQANTTLWFPLLVQDFTNMFDLKVTLRIADPAVAQFVGSPVLKAGFPGFIGHTSNGDTLTMSWQSSFPISLPPGDTLAMLPLFMTGNPGDSTAIWLPAGSPGQHEGRRRIGSDNLSLLLPGGDSTMIRIFDPVGLGEETQTISSLTAYPNPFGTSLALRIQLPAGEASNLQVHDPLGRVVWQQPIRGTGGPQQLSIPTTNWAKGVYLCRLSSSAGSLQQRVWRQ